MISLRRKILFYVFVIIFILAAPLSILVAAGYKINFSGRFHLPFVQKTGMILIETEPEKAVIYLNDKRLEKRFLFFFAARPIKTPYKIKNLSPGEYEVKLEMNNCWNWEKRVSVSGGQITILSKINLFRKKVPTLISAGDKEAIFSPDKKKAYLPQSGFVIDLGTEEKISAPLMEKSESAVWSDDSRHLLAGKMIVDLKNNGKNVNLEKTIGAGIFNLNWQNGDGDKIYYQTENSLNAYDFDKKQSVVLFEAKNLKNYFLKNGYWWLVANDGEEARLKIHSSKNKILTENIHLPFNNDYDFINRKSELVNLYDRDYKILYLMNAQDPIGLLEETIEKKGIKYVSSPESGELFYANDFEIFSFNYSSGQHELLSRLSEPLKSVEKIKDTGYIFYSTDKTIGVLNLLDGGKIQITELVKFDEVYPPIFNKDKKFIYFTGRNGDQVGLYKLEI